MSTTRCERRPSRLLVPVFLAIFVTTGCQTTVGNYFANRGRDLGECLRLQVGGCLGIGASANAAGVLHLGLAVASVPRTLGMGWDYGDLYAFGWGEKGRGWDGEADYTLAFPVGAFTGARGMETLVVAGESLPAQGALGRIVPPFHWQIERAPQRTVSRAYLAHACWMFVPAVFSAVADPPRAEPESQDNVDDLSDLPYSYRLPQREARFLWSGPTTLVNRRARIHAFDIEASVYAGIVYARAGFSPGELLDFLLGWFGVDIAGDDRSLEREEGRGEDVGEELWIPRWK